jgi:hypothetical protein
LKTRHQAKGNDQGGDANGDADRREQRHTGDRRLMPLGEQIPERDEELK